MKNTKHTENLDNSTPQEITSQSKRKILTSIGVSSGIIGASALSQQWTKPIVNSIILPAHAQSTPMMTTMAPGMMTTMAPGMMTTMAPAPASRIMVVAGQAGDTIGDGSMAEFHISLTEQPMNDVMVTVSADPSTSISEITGGTANGAVFVFTRADYMDEQTVTVAAIAAAPDPAGVTIKFAAEGGGYDDEENSVMLTIVVDNNLPATDVKAKRGTGANGKDVTVTWMKPDTTAAIDGYTVNSSAEGVDSLPVGKDMTTATFVNHPSGTDVEFTVTVDYKTGMDETTDADSDSTVTIP